MVRPARPQAVSAPGSDLASPPVFGAAVTTGSPPAPRSLHAVPRPLSPESRRKRQAAKRLWRLQRTLVEADRRKFLKGYNPEKVRPCGRGTAWRLVSAAAHRMLPCARRAPASLRSHAVAHSLLYRVIVRSASQYEEAMATLTQRRDMKSW